MNRQIEQLVWRRAQRHLADPKTADFPHIDPLPGVSDRLKKVATLNVEVADLPRTVKEACADFEGHWNRIDNLRSGGKLAEADIQELAESFSRITKLAGSELSVSELEDAVEDNTLDGLFRSWMRLTSPAR